MRSVFVGFGWDCVGEGLRNVLRPPVTTASVCPGDPAALGVHLGDREGHCDRSVGMCDLHVALEDAR